jgi:hypothetical protein
MTRLQQEILESFEDLSGDQKDMAIAAAEVAKWYIDAALDSCGIVSGKLLANKGTWLQIKAQWMKETGITE